jgi:putative CocE/NonD family hydrolase
MSVNLKQLIYEVELEVNIPIIMRDGVTLFADIYYPKGDQKFPVLLMRSPYDKTHSEFMSYLHPEWYARQGYIVVTQDSRGKYLSEGEFHPFHYERQDGLDTIEFVKKLPKSSGKIGMYGFSYVGATQLHPALDNPEGLTAIAPAFTNDGYYEDWSYTHGATKLAFLQSWSAFLSLDQATRKGKPESARKLMKINTTIKEEYDHLPLTDHPLIDKEITSFYYEWLKHPTFDNYWNKWHLGNKYNDFQLPSLHIGGWYDTFIEGTLRNFTGMSKYNPNQKLVIGPWYHMPWTNFVGDIYFGEAANNVIDDLQVRWYDHWLKEEQNGIMDEPPVSIFVMGENKWRQEQEWPLARTQFTPYFVHSKGRANSLNGDGFLSIEPPGLDIPDIYVYNPLDPVPSIGGHSCCNPILTPMGPKDQRLVEGRNDVLVYTSEVLTEDLEVTGPVEAIIFASSSANDTDFTVKLVDVHPDGMAINLLEGIQRASYRESNENPQPIIPGKVYEYRFHVGSTSNLFKQGHKIRIEISSSNFPAFDVNLNNFRNDKDGTYGDSKIATQKVFHDEEHPTRVILPIIPRTD